MVNAVDVKLLRIEGITEPRYDLVVLRVRRIVEGIQ
jgi:hypothetical protein